MCVLCYLCIALHPHSTTCKFAARRMTMYKAARRIPDLLCALQTYKITCGRRHMVDSLPARKLCTGLREPPRGICALRMYRELMPHASDLQPLRKLCTEVRERPQSCLPRCVCIARRPITITCKRHSMGDSPPGRQLCTELRTRASKRLQPRVAIPPPLITALHTLRNPSAHFLATFCAFLVWSTRLTRSR